MQVLLILFTLGCVCIILVILICNQITVNAAKHKTFSVFSEVPYKKVGILLGTSKYVSFGPVNPYYKNRIKAAVELLKSGKISFIIVSGAHSLNHYNEPEQMKADLIKEAIPEDKIFTDYYGFRTLDSMYRLKFIFGQNDVTVISQQFHNQRAIYIGKRLGIDAIGFNAVDLESKASFDVHVREKLARVKVFVDFLFKVRPKTIGKPVTIPN
ncbi:MAG: ElyC/SanA/YdcF family protein [Ginsengibacter sp.]